MATVCIIPAAGSGSRMGAGCNKVLLPLLGKPLIWHAVKAFEEYPGVDWVVVVARDEDREAISDILQPFSKVKAVLPGGAQRQDSVRGAVEWLTLEGFSDAGQVLIHDGARPIVRPDLIDRCLRALQQYEAVVPALPVKETVKKASRGIVGETIERTELWAVQTPQGFRFGVLRESFERASRDGFTATDDAALAEHAGYLVVVVEGDPQNLKVTSPGDLELAHFMKRGGREPVEIRTGIGYDAHAFAAGRPLVLGGVHVPFDRGLAGHSDADAAVHAIIDALLGAAGMDDIGRLFPDTDPAYKGADSIGLLEQVGTRLKEEGWRIGNIDAVIVAERPKVAPHVCEMRGRVARALGIDPAQVSLKGKTTEGMGFEGRGEGISVHANALIMR